MHENAVGTILLAIAVTPNRMISPEPATSAAVSTSGLMEVQRNYHRVDGVRSQTGRGHESMWFHDYTS